MDEMIPTDNVRLLMAYFPIVVVALHFLLAGLLGVGGSRSRPDPRREVGTATSGEKRAEKSHSRVNIKLV